MAGPGQIDSDSGNKGCVRLKPGKGTLARHSESTPLVRSTKTPGGEINADQDSYRYERIWIFIYPDQSEINADQDTIRVRRVVGYPDKKIYACRDTQL